MDRDDDFTVMTASEVAERLRVSRATVTRMAQRGELDRVPIKGRLLFTSSALVRFVTGRDRDEGRR
ncbi:helix-turn-helix domain-containing protein [Bosea sp. R86505]|uniref:helix-turn-helix domain-containing protein n=1 Tax=Bosea sp. R86505 TaxID=3101710 RepID=UPI00366A6D20